MDPVTLIVVPGFIGGIVIALLIARLGRDRVGNDPFTREPVSTDVINVARIRVAGVGGLGLVAMAAVVALNVPRIGQSLALGLVLGVLFAVVLIARRSRSGAMPSSGQRTGANTTLSIDAPAPSAGEKTNDADKARIVTPVSS